jgi:hypothetical protein
MRPLLLLCSFFLLQNLSAANPHKAYLLTRSSTTYKSVPKTFSAAVPRYFIPRYQTPKGAVFCRMEDKLTKATGIWIKIGVK